MSGACALVAAVALTPYFLKRQKIHLPLRVRQLQVSGLSRIDPVEVKDLVDLKKGDPLFGTWTQTTKEKVRTNPRVEGAQIARTLTGQVFMVVQERAAAALVNLNRLYYTDEQGNILGPAVSKTGSGLDLVVLTGPWSGRKSWDGLAARVREAMELKRTFVRAGTDEKQISELHLDPSKGWIAYCVGSAARIVVGQDGFAEKVARLHRVMQDFRGREKALREIDLDFDDRVVVKLES